MRIKIYPNKMQPSASEPVSLPCLTMHVYRIFKIVLTLVAKILKFRVRRRAVSV